MDDVQQRLVDVGAQVTQFPGEYPQPGPAGGRDLVPGIVEHVGERDHVTGVDSGHGLVERVE